MPGSVSDSYDPEFGTGANADDVRYAMMEAIERITDMIGDQLQYIVDVVHGEPGRWFNQTYSERELRVIRFALLRALETM